MVIEANAARVKTSLSAGTRSQEPMVSQNLREEHVNGDLGFDPLGLKPIDEEAFDLMRTKELQNGRLAMIGIAGMVAQELVNNKGIFETLGL